MRGKIVILQNFASPNSYGLAWNSLNIQDEFEIPCSGVWPFHTCNIGVKWPKVKEHIEEARKGAKEEMFVNFLSAVAEESYVNLNLGPTPEDVADYVNPKCLDYLTNYNNGETWRLGSMMMDFPTNNLINAIIAHNKFPPVLDLGPLYEGVCASEFFNRSCTFTDPGSYLWTITIDYGDGSGEQEFTTDDTSFLLNHKYDVGTYIITVRIVDDSSAEATGEITVSSKPCIRNIRIRTSG